MLAIQPPPGFSERPLKYGPFSPSRLITAKCPSRFYAQYIRKDKVVGEKLAADRGSAIHEVLSKITVARQTDLTLSSRQISDWVSEAVGMYPAAYSQIDLVKGAADAYVGNPSPYINKTTSCEKAFAVQYFEEDTFNDEATPGHIYVPVPYNIDGRPNPAAYFGGKIDQITIDEEIKLVTILDHKSTPSANENEDHTFQVGAYAWLVSLFYPGYRIQTVIHYAHPVLNFYAAPVMWSEEDLAEIESFIKHKIAAIEAFQSFPAVPNNLCDYCHITQECDVFTKVREQKSKGIVDLNVNSFDDLVRLAKELHVVDTMYGELTKALKTGIDNLCPTNGVNIGGLWYGYKASEESVDWQATDQKIRQENERAKGRCEVQSFESEEDRNWCEKIQGYSSLDELLSGYGVKPDGYKNYNGTKLKNLWRLDKPDLFEVLRRFIVKDKSTRFGGHKGSNI